MVVAIGVGVPLGIAAAKRQGSVFDNLATVASLIGISIPIFFLGLLLAYVFGVWLHWLPTLGRFNLRQYDFSHAGRTSCCGSRWSSTATSPNSSTWSAT